MSSKEKTNKEIVSESLSNFFSFLNQNRTESFIKRMQLILLAITIFLVTLALAYPNLKQTQVDLSANGDFTVGKNAPDTLIAITDIEFLREKSYEKAQIDAQNRAPLHFTRDYGLLRDDMQHQDRITTFRSMREEDFEILSKCRGKKDWDKIYYCSRNKSSRWRRLKLEEFKELAWLPIKKQRELQIQAMNLIFPEFVLIKKLNDKQSQELVKNFSGDFIFVNNLNHASSAKPVQISKDRLIRPQQLYNADSQKLIRDTIGNHIRKVSKHQRNALIKMSVSYLSSLDSSQIDIKKSKEEQLGTVQKIQRSEHTYKIKRGQVIIKKGDSITEEMRRSLEIHQEKRILEIIKRVFSIFLQLAILTSLMLYFSLKFSQNVTKDVSSNLIIFSTIWLFALLLVLLEKAWALQANEFEVTHFFGAWVPIGIFIVLLSIIFGEKLTIPIAMYISFLVFIASKYDGMSLMISMIMSMAASIAGSRVKRRVQFITTSLLLSFLNFLLIIAGYLYSNRPIFGMQLDEGFLSDGFERAAIVSIASGISTIAVIGLLPIYETIFNLPTRFRLQELTDPSHPLLKELFQKAPSTWTHTMMVAALTEKACERLKLNTMLARTGVYFHDIGKMKNAGFFAENQHLIPRDENINKDKPTQAAKVIIDHVLDGLDLAYLHRLPNDVIAFIPEHHGTSTMAFFYHQALRKMKKSVDRNDFRYPGPIPQSKETAIVMIADSVEAASRTLPEITEKSLNDLVQKIINIKLSENQLDDSTITLGDLSIVKEAFKDVLISSFHSRPVYPDQKSTKKLEEKNLKKRF